MKKHLYLKKLLLVIGMALMSLPQANAQCVTAANVYAFTFNGKKYELIKEKKTWAQAAECAVTLGAYLVHVDDAAEQKAVYDAIVTSGVPTNYNPVSDAGNVSYIWIGATDKATEGTWLWDGDNNGNGINFWKGQGETGTNDGTPVMGRYNEWGKTTAGVIREPDDFNSNQDAVGIAMTVTPSGSTQAGQWNDIAITNTLYYVIEYGETSNIKENDNHFLTLFPNPAIELITLSTGQPFANAYLRVFNSLGQLIIEKPNLSGNSFDLPIDALSKGIYFIELNQRGLVYKNKFVKE